jgi:hypothetical protein
MGGRLRLNECQRHRHGEAGAKYVMREIVGRDVGRAARGR